MFASSRILATSSLLARQHHHSARPTTPSLVRLVGSTTRSTTPSSPPHRGTRLLLTQAGKPYCGPTSTNSSSTTVTTTKLPTVLVANGNLLAHHGPASRAMRHAVLYQQLGAVTHLSSLGGGGGGRPPPRSRSGMALGGLMGAGALLLGKTKYVLAALKLTKFATLGSMIVSIGTYSLFFGWPYSVGMVGLIAVHEAGHGAVMHRLGIPFSPAVFVPFMGAVIAMRDLPRDAYQEAMVAAGGPALGSLGAAAVAVGAHATDSQLLFALADFGFMVNLFNLLPIGSMDGGRIAGALSPYASLAGLGLGGTLAYSGAVQNPIFYLILLAGGYDTFQRFYDPAGHTPPNYYKITTAQRAAITAGYFGLILALIAAMDANQRYKKSPEVLMREHQSREQSWDMR